MIRCISIDDSTLALDLLDDYISRIPYLERLRRCNNAVEAREILTRNDIDLIFLDIQMPDITGLDLLKSLAKKPKIIFTTAYPDYALEGYELDASDYLLKPFSFERFKKATDKVLLQIELEKKSQMPEKSIYVKSGHDIVKINLSDIDHVEALRDYVQIFTKEGKVLSLMSMKEIMEALPASDFARIHRSFIVPVNKVEKVSSKSVTIGKKDYPVGEIYREEFIKLLREKGIVP